MNGGGFTTGLSGSPTLAIPADVAARLATSGRIRASLLTEHDPAVELEAASEQGYERVPEGVTPAAATLPHLAPTWGVGVGRGISVSPLRRAAGTTSNRLGSARRGGGPAGGRSGRGRAGIGRRASRRRAAGPAAFRLRVWATSAACRIRIASGEQAERDPGAWRSTGSRPTSATPAVGRRGGRPRHAAGGPG